MSFATALLSMMRGHKVRRHHWLGYWKLEGDQVMMHCYDGSVINLKDSTNMLYTLQNIACDDWEVISYDDEEIKAKAISEEMKDDNMIMENNTIE
jgi:hypothetical protein